MQSQELDEDKRVEIVRTLEDFLVKEDPGPYVLLFWEARHKIANDRVKNFNLSALSWSALKYEHLWCDPEVLTYFGAVSGRSPLGTGACRRHSAP